MAATRFAWVLNLDADVELAHPQGYTPRSAVRAATAHFAPVLARSLLGPHDVLVDESSMEGVGRGLTGRAFCPTPRALAILRRAGAEPERAPSLDVLRLVNSRAFASSLGPTLPGGSFVTGAEEADAVLRCAPPVGTSWRVKRAFGMAGRGQRIIGSPTPADRAFIRAGIGEGGVQIEPNVPIAKEYAIHGMLAEDGSFRLGNVVEQHCDARGVWLSTEPLAASNDELAIRGQLADEGGRVAAALARAGYFGPFGIDAFSYRDRANALRFQPRSEINARYSMGFAIGLPDKGASD
jgi:hypothetical protein